MGRSWTLLIAAALLVAGCGPVEYVNQVTRVASAEVEAARAVRADKFAPYWYTLAVEYLHKAREEAAHADFQAANRFGRRSEEAARRAVELSVERAARGEAGGGIRSEPAEDEAPAPQDPSVPLGADEAPPGLEEAP